MPSNLFKELYKNRRIIKRLAIVDFQAEYRQTVGGILWGFLKPILMVAAISAAFYFRSGGESFDLYVVSVTYGIIFWNFMNDSIRKMADMVEIQKNNFRRTSISREVISVLAVIREIIDFIIGLVVIIGVHIIMKVEITLVGIGFLSLGFLLTIFLVYGIGLTLAILTVYIRDLKYLVVHMMRVLFFVTPIFLINLPKGILTDTLYFNPFSMAIFIGRNGIYPQNNIVPLVFFLTLWTILACIVGRIVFTRKIHDVVDIA